LQNWGRAQKRLAELDKRIQELLCAAAEQGFELQLDHFSEQAHVTHKKLTTEMEYVKCLVEMQVGSMHVHHLGLLLIKVCLMDLPFHYRLPQAAKMIEYCS
jgi:hypothetical protein